MSSEFFPKRGAGLEARLRHIEEALCQQASRLPPADVSQATAPPGQARADAPANSGGSGGGASGGSIGPNQGKRRVKGFGIREASIAWDSVDGHNHDGVTSRSITLLGDVSGTNPATTVDKLKGKALSGVPGAGDDGRWIKWNNGGNQFEYTVIDKVQGKSAPSPAAADNYKFLMWDNGGDAFALRGPTAAIVTKTAAYTATTDDCVLLADTTSGNFTITLPTPAASITGRIWHVKKIVAANTLSVSSGSGNIDGAAWPLSWATNNQTNSFICDGTNYWLL